MGTVTGFDPVTEHERTRAALAAAVPRLVRLLRDAPDLDAASGVPVWTVGDVGAHLAAVYLAYTSVASGDGAMDRDGLLPPGDVPFAERIAALDKEEARGVRIAFDLVVKGGPRLAIVVDDGTMTVTRDAPSRAYDCRLTVAPTAFLLVSFRRMPVWQAIARGRMRAGGRRPWLAPRLGRLVATP
ncbi:hypothetical protein EDD98_6019 [Streptomyces sp. PanSC19]|uniref:maleylpyruvate isomerase N-terminal domain-containing protein n=1 Tax=Streptomyces sp. PanSC19 TaxID=1520455 RepID=UPI000F4A3FE3|nr:maleylpyruvate isomerase N-terminal domain-containing protein [Streptomyces sp. PanSC19]ROQ26388.1 hypothetical protein EDD98_6019 [Streptomyces sp. PanSC19]